MAVRDNGNERDLRVRPTNDAKQLDGDNPYDGDRCDIKGEQTDLNPPVVPPVPDPNEPPPPPAGSEFDWSSLANLCPQGMTNNTVNQVIMNLLKNHFSSADRIYYAQAKQFIYSPDATQSKIRIQLNTTFNPAAEGQYPAIVVKRGPQQVQRVSIGDRVGATDLEAGTTKYVQMQRGVHRILGLATGPGFVEILGDELYYLFTCKSPIIRSILPFHEFRVTALSEVAIVEGLGQTLGVALDIAYAYEYSWTVVDNGPNLSTVIFDDTTALADE